MKIKAQVSVEILLIVSFVIFLFIPLILSSYSKATEVESNSRFQRESYLLYEISNNVELAYSTATGSEIKKNIFIPYSINSIEAKRDIGGTIILVRDEYGNEITEFTNALVSVDPALSTLNKKGYREFIFKKEYDSVNDIFYVYITVN